MGFDFRHGRLHCDGVSLEEIAAREGTPFYCYSADAIRERFRAYHDHFGGMDAQVCYAVKANSNQAVIGLLAGLGAGADVVSGGELMRALKAGVPADRVVFSGVAKTADEMRYALEQGIFQFNVESEPELERGYADLLMLVRPDMRQYELLDLLLEFKYVGVPETGLAGRKLREMPRDELMRLPCVEEKLSEGKMALQGYRKALEARYGEKLRLHSYVVVALGFERIVWEETSV